MKLEDLVPPRDLCKQIPLWKLEFAKSFFVWVFWRRTGTGEIKTREEVENAPQYSCWLEDLLEDEKALIFPAPTLQEIIPAIVESGGFHPEIMYKPDDEGNGNHWEVECFTKEDPDTVEDFTSGSPLETDSINPATAALKLWLRLAVEDGK